jgi:putative glutamine amidotransferase
MIDRSDWNHVADHGGRPVIGVTGPDRGGFVPWFFTALALYRAGARPRRIVPSRPIPEGLDGLVVGGGTDIDPKLYGRKATVAPSRRLERRHERMGLLRRLATLPRRLFKVVTRTGALAVDRPRDHLEITLLADAFANRRPVLGICRGAQLINVFFGGDLHQDLRAADLAPSRYDTILPRRPVRIAEGSRLKDWLGTTALRVNSLHNQAVRALGDGLRVAARDHDGIVQAIEHRRRPFFLGVQWHPEYLPQLRIQAKLFRGLVRQALRPVDEPMPARGEGGYVSSLGAVSALG